MRFLHVIAQCLNSQALVALTDADVVVPVPTCNVTCNIASITSNETTPNGDSAKEESSEDSRSDSDGTYSHSSGSIDSLSEDESLSEDKSLSEDEVDDKGCGSDEPLEAELIEPQLQAPTSKMQLSSLAGII